MRSESKYGSGRAPDASELVIESESDTDSGGLGNKNEELDDLDENGYPD